MKKLQKESTKRTPESPKSKERPSKAGAPPMVNEPKAAPTRPMYELAIIAAELRLMRHTLDLHDEEPFAFDLLVVLDSVLERLDAAHDEAARRLYAAGLDESTVLPRDDRQRPGDEGRAA